MTDEKHHHEEHHFEDEKPAWWKRPGRIILMLFLLLIVVLWAFPHYGIKLNPEPKNIPSLSHVQSQFLDGVEIGNETGISSIREARIDSNNPVIKQVATAVAAQSCEESRICHVKSLYYFIRDNIEYVSDPYATEYIASPIETLKVGGGDCDDGALALASLVGAVGVRTEIVVIPGHALIRAMIPEAPKKYMIDGWVYMDWTCSTCRFGELPYNDVLQLSD